MTIANDSKRARAFPRRLPVLLALLAAGAAPAVAQASGAPDFAALSGQWTEERAIEQEGLADACRSQPLWVHPDGVLVAWDARYGRPELRVEIACSDDGACTLLSDPDRTPPGLRVEAQDGRLSLCAGSECRQTFASCAGTDMPPDLLAIVSLKPVPLEPPTSLPPGLYVPMPMEAGVEPEWPDMLEACFSDPVAVWPDGVAIGLMQVETEAGPAFEAIYSETCTASSDPEWPLVCVGEDAFVAQETSFVQRARLVQDRNVGFVMETEEAEPGLPPRRVAMLQCTDDEGLGVNLDFDPRGAIILETLDGLRPPEAPPLRLGR